MTVLAQPLRDPRPVTSANIADIELAKIERALATMPALGDRINHLNHEIERFEDKCTEIERWLDRHSIGHWGNPFGPWSDDSALYVRLRLGAMHAELVEMIMAANAQAIARLPEECT